jgi:hypothetical protein
LGLTACHGSTSCPSVGRSNLRPYRALTARTSAIGHFSTARRRWLGSRGRHPAQRTSCRGWPYPLRTCFAGFAPRPSFLRRDGAYRAGARATSGSRSAIPPASPCSGSAARSGIGGQERRRCGAACISHTVPCLRGASAGRQGALPVEGTLNTCRMVKKSTVRPFRSNVS